MDRRSKDARVRAFSRRKPDPVARPEDGLYPLPYLATKRRPESAKLTMRSSAMPHELAEQSCPPLTLVLGAAYAAKAANAATRSDCPRLAFDPPSCEFVLQ